MENGLPESWDETADILRAAVQKVLGTSTAGEEMTKKPGGGMRRCRHA